jgi:hypothetical protein
MISLLLGYIIQTAVPLIDPASLPLFTERDIVSAGAPGAIPPLLPLLGPDGPSAGVCVPDSEDWGAPLTMPISWGRVDPPTHPDEGMEWSNTRTRSDRDEWDRDRGSFPPPPPVIAKDLFSDRGDGYFLGHSRRTGESADSWTIRPEFVYSRARASGEHHFLNDGEHVLLSIKEGERKSSSTKGEQESSSADVRLQSRVWGRLRESRKTPFSRSPPPSRSGFSFPRQYAFDDEMDAVLEAQRLEDERTPRSDPTAKQPKSKRDILSDREYQLRKERTDNLFEGIRRIRERSVSPSSPRPGKEEASLEIEEKGERLKSEEQLDRERKPVPLPDNFEPPPPFHGAQDDDSDGGDDPKIIGAREALASVRIGGGARHEGKGPTIRVALTVRQLRRVMAAKESLFKFGTFVPRSEREADASPEAPRWRAGRDLEWFRLREQGTFERDWTWARVQVEHAAYKKSDIGFLFYVDDYKFSGEHRVRLVFDGSRQSAETYAETYASTARQESVRLFHVVCVEESFGIGQYDVLQAFLKAFIDFDIFVHPPRGQAKFEGQILKLRRALYGGKQSAYLWFQLMNEFILELGFVASALDWCLYKREDAVLILFCDDLRIGASDPVLSALHSSFFDKFGITTASGDRFLGMDTCYQRNRGIMKLSMESYVSNTMDRFRAFDTSRGYPYREIVGRLLWITLCVMGPELLRVKDLARRSNDYNAADYQVALKLLIRIYDRREHGIVLTRGAAGKESAPSSARSVTSLGVQSDGDAVDNFLLARDDTGILIDGVHNELLQKSLLLGRRVSPPDEYVVSDPDSVDIARVLLPVNPRYGLVVYADASFAVGEQKQSVSGFVVYLNGVPLLWGSLKQTIVVNSSCSAEFVAASIACKQLLHAENMVGFFGFSCPKSYRFYTDSKACLHIATNLERLGNVRHLQIRYHLVRCCVSLGDLDMVFCVTKEMVADLFTKLVMAAQDTRLTFRFYSLIPAAHPIVASNDFKRA